jgi:hypothetical protein
MPVSASIKCSIRRSRHRWRTTKTLAHNAPSLELEEDERSSSSFFVNKKYLVLFYSALHRDAPQALTTLF